LTETKPFCYKFTMVKTLTKQELLDLYSALNQTGNLTGAKFAYAVARNLTTLKGEVDALNAAYAPTEAFMEYDRERVKLAELHAVKTDNGTPLQMNGKYELVDEAQFNKELDELKAKFPGLVDARQKQLDDFKKILEEKIDVTLHTVTPENLPQDISAQQMTGIILIVEEAN
jgi:hypothetical protein